MKLQTANSLFQSTAINVASLIAFIFTATFLGWLFDYDIKEILIKESLGETVHAAGLLIAFISISSIYIIELVEIKNNSSKNCIYYVLKKFLIGVFGYTYALPVAFIIGPLIISSNHNYLLWISTLAVIVFIPLMNYGVQGVRKSKSEHKYTLLSTFLILINILIIIAIVYMSYRVLTQP